jgi:hypothetical protein
MYFQKSFRSPLEPCSAKPFPPKRYKLLNESTHETALDRAPGILSLLGTPFDPKFPRSFFSFEPFIQIQFSPSNFQKSFNNP